MNSDLTKLLSPKSIAVIGASRENKKIGNIVIRNIIESGFKGKVYPVNPNSSSILKLKCFPDIDSLPEIPDLAIISLPSSIVVNILEAIGKKGIKDVLIFTAGFKEAGEEGKALEEQLISVSKKYSLNILGPNCLGFINNNVNLNATFGKSEKIPGNLKFISQSGAIATSIFDWAGSIGLGFSEFVTLGNKSILNETHILNHWNDNKTESIDNPKLSNVNPIGMYLESIDFGEDFLNIASQMTLTDPLFILKPGKSKSAKKAMQSHTGSLAGQDDVMDAAFKQVGIIRCSGIEDMFDLSKAFSWENMPLGPNVAIVSNAGGPAVVSSDFIESEGLSLAKVDDDTLKDLQKYLPRAANMMNPIDVLGDALAERYAIAIEALLKQNSVHSMLVLLTPQIMTQIYSTAEIIAHLSEVYNKPIICSFMGGSNIEKGEKILNLHKIPSYRFPERAIKALGTMYAWRKNNLERISDLKKMSYGKVSSELNDARISSIDDIINIVRNKKTKTLNSFESNKILESWDIKTPPSDFVSSFFDALLFAQKNGFPVVLKISSNKVLHKKDIGGVIANIKNRQTLFKSLRQLKRRISQMDPEMRDSVSIQIQKQVAGGTEIILGVKKDSSLGPVMMFGAGGTFAEVISDKNLRMLPVNKDDAKKVVENSKIYKILKGYRGDKPMAVKKLFFLMEKFSELTQAFPEFEEIEINPVIITEDDVWAVDGKVILS